MLSKQAQEMLLNTFKKLNKSSVKYVSAQNTINDEKRIKLSKRIELSHALFTDVSKNNPQMAQIFDLFTLQAACSKITGYANSDAIVSLWLVYFFKQLVAWQYSRSQSGAVAFPCFVSVVRHSDSPMILISQNEFAFQANTRVDLDLLDENVWVVDPVRSPNKPQGLDEFQLVGQKSSNAHNLADVLFVPMLSQWLSKASIDQFNQVLSVVPNAYADWSSTQHNQNESGNKIPVIIDQDEYVDKQSVIDEQIEELFLRLDPEPGDNIAVLLNKLKSPLSQIKTTKTSLFNKVIDNLKKNK